MTDEQWHRTVIATMLMWVLGAFIYFVFAFVTSMFGLPAVSIAVIVGAVLAGRAIGIHTTWLVGEEGKLLYIRAPSNVIEEMMRGSRCEHQVMLSNRPTVEIPLVTMIVTCAEKDVLLPPIED